MNPITRAISTLALLAMVVAMSVGCNRENPGSTPAAAPPQPAPPPPPTPAQVLETNLTHVVSSFEDAPEATQARIRDAIASIQSGATREGISRLKMVDADSSISTNQQESLRRLIRAVRETTPAP